MIYRKQVLDSEFTMSDADFSIADLNLYVGHVGSIKQESSDSLDTSQNLSANRSFYSIASSGSTSIRSLSESFKEVDEDSQFSYTSSTRTDSWLTEQELKPNGIINLFLFIINSSEVFILSQT